MQSARGTRADPVVWGGVQTHDDAARFLSWMWTMVKSVDKAEAVAKVILLDECRRRDDIWAWIK